MRHHRGVGRHLTSLVMAVLLAFLPAPGALAQDGGAVEASPFRSPTWTPGTVHEYRVDPRGAPKGQISILHSAFKEVARLSGTTWKYAGTTRVRFGDIPPANTMVISWYAAPKIEHDPFSVDGGGWSVEPWFGDVVSGDENGEPVAVGGMVVLNPVALKGARGKTRARILHALGHAMGLGEDMRPGEVMNPNPGGNGRVTAGMLAALAAIPGMNTWQNPDQVTGLTVTRVFFGPTAGFLIDWDLSEGMGNATALNYELTLSKGGNSTSVSVAESRAFVTAEWEGATVTLTPVGKTGLRGPGTTFTLA